MFKKITLIFLLFTSVLEAQCFTNVVSNQSTIVIRKSDGTLWSRGDNNTGLAGNGTTSDVIDLTQIGTDSDWSNEFCLGFDKAYAIKNNGTLWYWGGIQPTILPTQIGSDTDWVKVSSTDRCMAAIKSNGTLWTMGSNSNGCLGIGNTDNNYVQNTPIQVGTSSDWQSIFSGMQNFYAIKSNGTLWSWGKAEVLGYALTSNSQNSYPNQVGTDTWKIATGTFNKTFGIKTDGTLYGWGSDVQHLISPSITFHQFPVQIGLDTDWKTVEAAQNFVIGLKENHTRWGWGSNWQNNLGNGNIIDIAQPTQLDSDVDWEMINIGLNGLGSYSSAIKQNGTHYCWKGIWPPLSSGVYQFPVPTVIFQNCTLSIDDVEKDMISFYPNPTEGIINIDLRKINNPVKELNIINNLGQIVMNKSINLTTDNVLRLDISSLSDGVYILILKNETLKQHCKIIKK
jgi:alpha-tubulin suppressor-like RCC1 family protein